MKICAIICEFNPFHNGHKYILNKARELSGCDAILCIMSGNFTQRGEMCVLDKFTRARHAVLGGADCVIQLPAPFTVAPAEIFAEGAIKILSSIPEVNHLAFGSESGDIEKISKAAKILCNENTTFKQTLTKALNCGESYIKSYCQAFETCGGNASILQNPNDVLALEYTKAILKLKPTIEILPIKRIGSGYNDGEIKQNYSSASAIRANLHSPLIKSNLPDYVYNDLQSIAADVRTFENIVKYAIVSNGTQSLAKITGCKEGLENKLSSLSHLPVEEIIAEATGKRYTSSRIRRILTCNALKLYESDCKKYLKSDLYIKPLAVGNELKDKILNALNRSEYPVVIRQRDTGLLSGIAAECFEKDIFESKVWAAASGASIYDYSLITV